MKKINYLIILLILNSCEFTNSQEEEKEKEENYYVVQPHYEHLTFKKLEAAFAKEEHRFEFDRCEFKYNDKSFFIGDSYEEIIAVFGEPDEPPTYTFDKKSYSIHYEKLKIHFWFPANKHQLDGFNMRMTSNYDRVISSGNRNGHEDTPYTIIKFRKVPYHLDMTMNQFMKLSDLRHGSNLEHDHWSFYILNEEYCDTPIETSIGSKPSYETSLSGFGHMTTTEIGDFEPEITYPIFSFSFSLIEDEN